MIGNLQLRILYEMDSDEDYSGLIGFDFNGSAVIDRTESDNIVDTYELHTEGGKIRLY